MTMHRSQDFIRHLCRARRVAEDGHLSDAQLLERFATGRDEAAFEVLVWRHGPLVLHVARRLVRHSADAEDVFQATFLTLARKAATIRRGTSVASWLYKVAYRIALRVRQSVIRRECRQQLGVENLAVAAPAEYEGAETAAIVADEVSRLPERYRAAVVLCYLQGSTTEEAARVLGCPRGTVLSRLAWARHRLSKRLIRRGVAPPIVLAAAWSVESVSAMPSVALIASVIRAALPFAAGKAAIPAISPQVAALARGALQTMLWNKIKIAVVVTCMLGLMGAGAGWLTRGRAGAEPVTVVEQVPQPSKEANKPDHAREAAARIVQLRKRIQKLDKDREELERVLLEYETRHRLSSSDDDLRRAEQKQAFERERERVRLKLLDEKLLIWEKKIIEAEDHNDNDRLKRLQERRERTLADLRHLEKSIEERENQRSNGLVNFRLAKAREEVDLRREELHFRREREDVIAEREALAERLRHLEVEQIDPSFQDNLRDMERKLNALRRDVNELRRAIERQNGDLRKKP